MILKFLSLDLALCLFTEDYFILSFILSTFTPSPYPRGSDPNFYFILFDYYSARMKPTSAITAFLLGFNLIPIADR